LELSRVRGSTQTTDKKKFKKYFVPIVLKVFTNNMGKYVKGKADPLQALSGPESSRKVRFPDFMTTAQDGGKVVSLTHQPTLPPGNTPGIHFC
jgi:hypothetical protein